MKSVARDWCIPQAELAGPLTSIHSQARYENDTKLLERYHFPLVLCFSCVPSFLGICGRCSAISLRKGERMPRLVRLGGTIVHPTKDKAIYFTFKVSAPG